jgi:hypothetical protein
MEVHIVRCLIKLNSYRHILNMNLQKVVRRTLQSRAPQTLFSDVIRKFVFQKTAMGNRKYIQVT